MGTMRLKRYNRRQRMWQKGFTLIEMIVIIAIIGVLGAVATPSFTAMIDGIKVTQTITDLQTALQDAQRQAIRKNQVCTVQVPQKKGNGNGNGNQKGNGNGNGNQIMGNCLTSGSPVMPDNVSISTNMQSTLPVVVPSNLPAVVPLTLPLSNVIEVKFGTLGSADFSVLSTVRLPLLPTDPTGKVVAFVENSNVPKKCVAISSTLGLTRVGIYTGSTAPADITDKGICTALDWKQQ